jgi:hypothetical protein
VISDSAGDGHRCSSGGSQRSRKERSGCTAEASGTIAKRIPALAAERFAQTQAINGRDGEYGAPKSCLRAALPNDGQSDGRVFRSDFPAHIAPSERRRRSDAKAASTSPSVMANFRPHQSGTNGDRVAACETSLPSSWASTRNGHA